MRKGEEEAVDPRLHEDYPETLAPAPRANPHLVGHGEAERRLADAAASGAVAGAWLIGGPQGIGKTTLAYRLARHLLAGPAAGGLFGDEDSGTLTLDEADPVFTRVATGGHGDLLTIKLGFNEKTGRKRSVIDVDSVRKMAPFFHQSAGEGGWRFALIDGAELMNPSASNAALKLIEEPPPRSVVVLVSHAPARLLPTIRSRCRKLHLQPLETEQVEALLARYLPDLPDDDRAVLAHLAEGSPGRALELDALGGVALYRELVGTLASLPHLDAQRLHAFAEKMGRYGNEAACGTVLEFLSGWLARLVRGSAGGQAPAAFVEGEAALIERFRGLPGLARWVDVWEKTARLRERAESLNLDRKQVLLAVFGALQAAARP